MRCRCGPVVGIFPQCDHAGAVASGAGTDMQRISSGFRRRDLGGEYVMLAERRATVDRVGRTDMFGQLEQVTVAVADGALYTEVS